MEDAELLGVDYIGDGPSGRPWSSWKKRKFVFQNFADMKQKRNEFVVSKKFECHGKKWSLQFYPKRHTTENSKEEIKNVSLYLLCVSLRPLSLSLPSSPPFS